MKILTIVIASTLSFAALADGYYHQPAGYAEAGSSAGVSSMTTTGNFGNGFAMQGTGVSANNQSAATINVGRGSVETSAQTSGSTSSISYGRAYNALGMTGGFAGQTGAAGAEGITFVREYRPH